MALNGNGNGNYGHKIIKQLGEMREIRRVRYPGFDKQALNASTDLCSMVLNTFTAETREKIRTNHNETLQKINEMKKTQEMMLMVCKYVGSVLVTAIAALVAVVFERAL